MYVILIILFSAICAFSQQLPDTAFSPPIANPAFAAGKGPVVAIDAAHYNFHTADGRYQAFAKLLRRDGFRVEGFDKTFSQDALAEIDILVIANALARANTDADPSCHGWALPTEDAFTQEEIAAAHAWVMNGGSLLLIADHMPFPGCTQTLAEAFGIRLTNGFAIDTTNEMNFTFSHANHGLGKHAITNGIDSVRSFTGEAIQPDSGMIPLMILKPATVILMPSVAWEFNEQTAQLDCSGWYQGAVKQFGKGRVAVFGEAAMFSAQLAGPNKNPVGMNNPEAPQNAQFLLNTLHWLANRL